MRIAHPTSQERETPATSMNGEERESVYQVLVDRCQSLEEKQAKLMEQCHELVKKQKLNSRKEEEDEEEVVAADSISSMGLLSGFFFSGSPYENVLKCMGHAVHVYRASSGEIIYWYSR